MLTACAWGRRRVLLALTAIAFVVASTTVFKSVISAPWLASLAATRRLRIAPSYLNDCVGPRNAKGSLRKRGQCGRFGPHLTSFLAFKPPLFAVLLIDDAAEQVKRASEASVAAGSLVLANANAAKMLRSPEGADTTDALQLAAEKAELVKRTREVDEEMQRVRNVQLELQEAADFCVANGLFAQVRRASGLMSNSVNSNQLVVTEVAVRVG